VHEMEDQSKKKLLAGLLNLKGGEGFSLNNLAKTRPCQELTFS